MGLNKSHVPLETYEQQSLITWVDTFHPVQGKLLFAIPNGGSRHPAEAVRLKAEGVRPGVLDLFYMEARGNYHGLFIEMKRRKQSMSIVSGGQEGFIGRAKKQGYAVRVCWGAQQAKEALGWYWALPEFGRPVESDPEGLLNL
jgi:hypothetical protein